MISAPNLQQGLLQKGWLHNIFRVWRLDFVDLTWVRLRTDPSRALVLSSSAWLRIDFVEWIRMTMGGSGWPCGESKACLREAGWITPANGFTGPGSTTCGGLLKKAASGVLAIFPCSRTGSTLCAQNWLRSCWTKFFKPPRGL